MNKLKSLKEIRQALGRVLFNFEEVTTSDGLIITYTGELAVGAKVYTYDENGETIPLADGTYELTVIGSIVVLNGEISEIIKPTDVVKPKDESEDAEDFSVKIKQLEDKVTAKFEEVNNILNSIITKYEEFSNQIVDKPVEKQKIVIEDTKLSGSKAVKYFNK